MATKDERLFELMGVSPSEECLILHLVLEPCEFCSIGFEPEDLKEYEGYRLCEECRAKHKCDVERVRIENQLQTAMDALPADELITLRYMLSIVYQQLEDKSNCENINKWNDRITSALASKSSKMKTSYKKHENTQRLHA